MNKKEIKTQSVGRGVAKTTPVVLKKTPQTRLIFYPLIHTDGVRGVIRRFKKSKSKKIKWEDLTKTDFTKIPLGAGEFVEVDLSTNAVKELMNAVSSRQEIVDDGIRYGFSEYVTVDKNTVVIINDKNKKKLLEQVLEKGYSDDFWSILTDNEPELASRLSASHLQIQRRNTVNELKERLRNKYPETQGDHSWQSWIFAHNWLFGANYLKPIEKQKINISGVMPDYLFPTVDGFVDILEIKLPSDDVVLPDKAHKGAWRWTGKTNKAIGQVVNYLEEISENKLKLEKNIKQEHGKDISLLKPRAFVLIGDSEKWSQEKIEGLRKLNHSMHGIEVITYRDLARRGEAFLESPIVGTVEKNKYSQNEDLPF